MKKNFIEKDLLSSIKRDVDTYLNLRDINLISYFDFINVCRDSIKLIYF
jgi:hypothetical protein